MFQDLDALQSENFTYLHKFFCLPARLQIGLVQNPFARG